MNKNLIVLLIIGGVLVFILGGGIGVLYKTQEVTPQLEKGKAAEASLKILSSKLMHEIVTYGEVSNIDRANKTFTISVQGDSLKVVMKKDALVYLLSNDSKGVPVRTQVSFEDIKDKDMVRPYMEFSSDGQIVSFLVMIITPGVRE